MAPARREPSRTPRSSGSMRAFLPRRPTYSVAGASEIRSRSGILGGPCEIARCRALPLSRYLILTHKPPAPRDSDRLYTTADLQLEQYRFDVGFRCPETSMKTARDRFIRQTFHQHAQHFDFPAAQAAGAEVHGHFRHDERRQGGTAAVNAADGTQDG